MNEINLELEKKECEGIIEKSASKLDYTGKKFGLLTVLRPSLKKRKENVVYWECACICGKIRYICEKVISEGRIIYCCDCGGKKMGRKSVDFSGRKVGDLTVIEKDYQHQKINQSPSWKCVCDCGEIKYKYSDDLVKCIGVTCRCQEIIPSPGMIYGGWRVIAPILPKNFRALWSCQCLKCGKIADRDTYHLRSNKYGCGCDISRFSDEDIAFNRVWSGYKMKQYKGEFTLSEEDFKFLTKQDCFYCKNPPATEFILKGKERGYIYNGIDRLDNNKGYTLKNCRTACIVCNWMKGDYEYSEFCEQLVKISEYDSVRKNIQSPKNRMYTQKKYREYINNSQKRGIVFNIPKPDFNRLVYSNCYFCGNIENNGIDRIDSDGIYEMKNVVTCCGMCNYMKQSLGINEFYSKIGQIVNNLKLL